MSQIEWTPEDAEKRGRLFHKLIKPECALAVSCGYWASGRLHFRYFVLRSELHGQGASWYRDGRRECLEYYRCGVKHGPFRTWHVNGQPREACLYRDGALHGERMLWCRSGKVDSQEQYQKGRLHGLRRMWHPNGQLKLVESYREGRRHGECHMYDEMGRLTGQSYYIRNRQVPGRLYELSARGQLTAKDIIAIPDFHQRLLFLQELGYERFMAQVPHKTLQTDGDRTLIRIVWRRDEEPMVLVKVRCPSTGTYYALRVPPKTRTIQEAVGWTFGVRADIYHPIEES
ncbi:MAG: hypothetical protein Q8P24_16525 [Desulfobacterales bacterium]|nr:hypothetical protein [Desulfobacterales bacterium]